MRERLGHGTLGNSIQIEMGIRNDPPHASLEEA
jgi:hypothetical protein